MFLFENLVAGSVPRCLSHVLSDGEVLVGFHSHPDLPGATTSTKPRHTPVTAEGRF
jgi:hypothetical protein